MNLKRVEFLEFVKTYVEYDPESAAYVADFVQKGLSSALSESRERAADMEVAVAVLLHRKHKTQDGVIFDKINKWKDKSSLNWAWYLKGKE